MAGGQAITTEQGSLTATQVLTGSEIASATGFVASPASDVEEAATGEEATFAQTSPSSADMSVRLRSRKVGGGAAAFAITGQASTVAQESITRVVSVLLGGSGISTAQGAFTKQRSRLLSGSQAQGLQGNVTGPSANENTPPQWSTVQTVTFYQGIASNQSVASFVDDYDNDVISFTKTAGSLPSGVTFNAASQRYEYNGSGAIAGTNGHILSADDGPADLPPYRVSDMVTSGPNATNFNDRLGLRWANPSTGDWMDSSQTPQGSSPYTTLAITQDAVGLKTWTVTALVQRWMTNPNRGFYLRASNTTFTYDFSGRLNATVANRPKLTVVTNVSTFICPCLASARWSPTSDSVLDGTDFIRVNSATRQAIVQFDLSSVTGTVTSATLQLYCSLAERTGNVDIYEANPPTPQVGGDNQQAVLGLAANYTYDIGIDAHPDVLFATDFPNSSAWDVTENDLVAYTTYPADARTQSNYVKSKVPAGDLNGLKLIKNTMFGTTAGSVPIATEDELYFRYYVMYEDGWGSDVDSNKMPGFDMRMGRWDGDSWDVTHGNGGSFGDGKKYSDGSGGFTYQGMSARGHSGQKAFDGHVYDDIFCLRSYIYQSFFTSFSDPLIHVWNGFCISKNRWFCIEHYCRMNSLTGSADALGNRTAVADGIYRTWVDGVLAWEKTNFSWRCHPEIGIQGIWMENYHGGTTPPDVDLPFRWNHVVVSRSYIGPRRPV